MLIRTVVAVILVFSLLISGCQPGQEQDEELSQEATQTKEVEESLPDNVSQATLNRYQVSEIREYQGVNLDPSIGPRDNSIKGIQYVDIATYSLTISGLTDTTLTLTYDEVLEYPAYEKVTTLYCVEGWEATILWKGVRISDLLEAAGMSEEAKTIIFKAVDGYTTSMPIETILERDMILAYQSNTIDLPPEMGYPFIVVAEDKLGYKWARWVNVIQISDDEYYEGFWESRGYSNDAEVIESRKEAD